jgi:F0F1-type ATP synthase delta subunit
MSDEKLNTVAQRFTEHFHITDYSVVHEVDKELIGGFVIYAAGYRYDYSVKGQLPVSDASLRIRAPFPRISTRRNPLTPKRK